MRKELSISLLVQGLLAGTPPALSQAAPPIIAPPQLPAVAASLTPAPPVPQTPTATDLIATVQSVCLPVLRGGKLAPSAKAAGFRQKEGQWVLAIDGQRRIELEPPDPANPHLCSSMILSTPGSGPGLRLALDAWARRQTPPLAPVKVDDMETGPRHQWAISSWSAPTAAGAEGLVFSHEVAPTSTVDRNAVSESTLMVSLTPS